jgi:hypothetical protein
VTPPPVGALEHFRVSAVQWDAVPSGRQGGETMKQLKHWQDPVNAVIGAWLVLSPWALGFQGETTALWNFVAVGVLLLATALGAIFLPMVWEEWTESALGLWLVISPWVLGFSAIQSATVNAVAAGLVILTLALWALQDETGWMGGSTTA